MPYLQCRYEGQLNAENKPNGFGIGFSQHYGAKVEGSFVHGEAHGRSKQ